MIDLQRQRFCNKTYSNVGQLQADDRPCVPRAMRAVSVSRSPNFGEIQGILRS